MPLEAGSPAPSISARNQHDELVEPSFEDPTVLYFYPKDDTPGCTMEATQFDTELETYHEAGVDVYGVSVDDVDSHHDFAVKQDLSVTLLADPDGEIADAFEVERGPRGATARTTFVIADGTVHSVYTGVNPDGHAREVMLDLMETELVDVEL